MCEAARSLPTGQETERQFLLQFQKTSFSDLSGDQGGFSWPADIPKRT